MSATVKTASRCSSLVGILPGLAALLLARPAAAHPEPASTLVNRYVTVSLQGKRVDLHHALLYGELTAVKLRREIDQDGDLRLDGQEIARYERQLAARAAALVQLRLDGRPLPVPPVARLDLNGEAGVRPVVLVVELTGWAPIAAGTHRLEVQLGPDLPGMGHTDLMLETDASWSLLDSAGPDGAARGRGGHRYQLPHSHVASAAAQVVVFQLRAGPPAVAPPPSAWRALGLAVAVTLGVVLLALVLVRRQRQRSARPGQ